MKTIIRAEVLPELREEVVRQEGILAVLAGIRAEKATGGYPEGNLQAGVTKRRGRPKEEGRPPVGPPMILANWLSRKVTAKVRALLKVRGETAQNRAPS